METQTAVHNLKCILHVTFWEFLVHEHTMFLREIYPKGFIFPYLIKDIIHQVLCFPIKCFGNTQNLPKEFAKS